MKDRYCSVLTTEHGGGVCQAVDPRRGRVVGFKVTLKLHKEDGDAPARTNTHTDTKVHSVIAKKLKINHFGHLC